MNYPLRERYPMFHCQMCGRFFRDYHGSSPCGLDGHQLSVMDMVCQDCKEQERQEQERLERERQGGQR
jgi:hypothetical protein